MIYSFKATFDTSKGFMRQYELRGDHTLYEFHEHMVDDMNFAPDQMVAFRSTDSKGAVLKQYGLFDLGDGSVDQITIEQLVERKETTLLYVFDMRDNRFLRLSYVGAGEALPRKSYPRTSDEKGDPPSQFANKQNESDYENDAADDLIDASEIGNTVND